MDKAYIAGRTPVRVDLVKGEKYAWCSCGASENQPWCDGSHKGTKFSPTVFIAEETKSVGMCMCKLSEKPQFCDGNHKRIKG